MTQLIYLGLDTWELTSQQKTVLITFHPLTRARLLPKIPPLDNSSFGVHHCFPWPSEILNLGSGGSREVLRPLKLYAEFSKVFGYSLLMARVTTSFHQISREALMRRGEDVRIRAAPGDFLKFPDHQYSYSIYSTSPVIYRVGKAELAS